jgi:hypothetical protein
MLTMQCDPVPQAGSLVQPTSRQWDQIFEIQSLVASHEPKEVSRRVNKVNVVNVGERYKNVTFTTYLHESKALVNVVNVARG